MGRDEDLSAIRDLLAAGSASLGGARPKASVLGDQGDLLLAKFPHQSDEWDVMAWEKTALDLAERAGITAPARRLIPVGGRRVLLLRRFDRAPVTGHRIGYISAMTLVAGRDGDAHDYVDIADYLPEHGANVTADLHELFRRAAFNVAVHNTDDHLRNHGFLGSRAGWSFSPVFDVNPNPDVGQGRTTSIAGARLPAEEPDGLSSLAAECRLSGRNADQVIHEVRQAVSTWREVAEANGVTERERERVAETFENGSIALSAATSPHT